MRRGPYKRYEWDPSVLVPKTTSYYKRRRNCEEEEATEKSSRCDDVYNMVGVILSFYNSLLGKYREAINLFDKNKFETE